MSGSSQLSKPGQSDLSLEKISLNLLKIPDDLFDSACFSLQEKIDLFTPLIVYRSGNSFTIIDGCKRFLAIKESGTNECFCCIADSVDDPLCAGLLRISLNTGRSLRFREKLIFNRWLKENLDPDEYSLRLQSIGIESRERFCLEKLLGAPPELISLIDSGHADFSVSADIVDLDPDDQRGVMELFSRLSFSRQTQRELLEWLPELSFRLKKPIRDILNADELQKIIGGKLNDPQKIQKIRDYFFVLRFPKLAEAKRVWSSLAAEINPDSSRVNFQPSEAFEKNRLEVKIAVTNASMARTIFSRLGSIPQDSWEKLINPALLWSTKPERTS